MRKWLYLFFFGDTGRVVALEAEVLRLKAEVEEKTQHLHAFYDAILLESGRNPIFSRPEVVEQPQQTEEPAKPNTAPIDELKALEFRLKQEKNPRAWSVVASALQKKVMTMHEQGLYIAGER